MLSGGEKSRLALVKLLLDPPNLLLMDEPTTHLDIGSIDALIDALKQYEGTLIFISHDVHFIRAIAQTVLHISAGKLVPYAGDYDYYLSKSQAENARAALTAGEKLTDSRPGGIHRERRRGPVRQRHGDEGAQGAETRRVRRPHRSRQKARQDREKRAVHLEREIIAWETRQKIVAGELEDPAIYLAGGKAMDLNREMVAIAAELQRLTAEWETAAATATAEQEHWPDSQKNS